MASGSRATTVGSLLTPPGTRRPPGRRTGSPVRVWPSASASAFSARSAAFQPRSTSVSTQVDSASSLSQLERSWPKIGVFS